MVESSDKLQEGELTNGPELVKFWLTEIQISKDWKESFVNKGKNVIKAYSDKRSGAKEESAKKVNLYWSSIQTIKPQVFSENPNPRVKRRNADRDKIKRISAEILQRSLSYSLDCHQDFNYIADRSCEDFLVPGLGVLWERYEPTIDNNYTEQIPVTPEEIQAGFSTALNKAIKESDIKQGAQGFVIEVKSKKIVNQESVTEYVQWDDFFTNPARTADEIRWKARRHFFNKARLKKEFSKIADEIKLLEVDAGAEKLKLSKEEQKRFLRVAVYEIWNFEDRKVYYICEGYEAGALKIIEDELKLKRFFPSSEVTDFATTESILPIPEYCMAQDQLEEINALTDRIGGVMASIRANAACPKELKNDLELLLTGDNKMVGVNWPAFMQSGGFQGIQWTPIEPYVAVLQQLYAARESAKQLYYEITRQSDIMRGATNPNETAAAQEIKQGFGSVTIDQKRSKFEKFLARIVQIKGEIIAEHFEPEILWNMCGLSGFSEPVSQEEFFQAVELLRNNPLRDYAIDIETDSTIAADDNENRRNVSEFVGSITPYLQQVIAALQQTPQIAPALIEMLLMFMRSFKVGIGVEDAVEQGIRQILDEQQAAKNAPQQPPPQDPMIVQLQNEAAIQHEKNEYQLKIKQVELQQHERDLAREDGQALANAALEKQKLDIEREKVMLDAEKQRNDFWLALEELKLKAEEAQREQLTALQEQAKMAAEPVEIEEPELEKEKPEPKEAPPIHVHVNMPQAGSKIARFRTGPTGEREAVIEDMQPVTPVL